MNRVLIVGCGNIGYRHLEATAAAGAREISIIEKNLPALQTRIAGSHLKDRELRLLPSLEDLGSATNFDCVISGLTTTAQVALFPQLLALRAGAYLFEKPLAQSLASLESLAQLVRQGPGDERVFVNCSRDTWKGYQEVRQRVTNARREGPRAFHFEVFGNLWGLGCNAVHFLELFRLFTGATAIEPVSQQITPAPQGNKRGAEFDEYVGTLAFQNEHGDTLQLTSAYAEPNPRGLHLTMHDKATGQAVIFIDEEKDVFVDLLTPTRGPLHVSYVSQTTRHFLDTQGSAANTPRLPRFCDVVMPQAALLRALTAATGRDVCRIT